MGNKKRKTTRSKSYRVRLGRATATLDNQDLDLDQLREKLKAAGQKTVGTNQMFVHHLVQYHEDDSGWCAGVGTVHMGTPAFAGTQDGKIETLLKPTDDKGPLSTNTWIGFEKPDRVLWFQVDTGQSPQLTSALDALARASGIDLAHEPLIPKETWDELSKGRHRSLTFEISAANAEKLGKDAGSIGEAIHNLRGHGSKTGRIEVTFVEDKNRTFFAASVLPRILRQLRPATDSLDKLLVDRGSKASRNLLADELSHSVTIEIPKTQRNLEGGDALAVIRDAYSQLKDKVDDGKSGS